MLGLVYLMLSIAALLFWRFDPQISCTSEACLTVSGLLGRPWYMWGAVFYAVAGMLCLGFRKNQATGAFLVAGAVFHAGLVAYGYAVTGSVCPVCWKFAAMGALLAVFYWVLHGREPGPVSYLSGGPARALAVITAALLIINPPVAVQIPDNTGIVKSKPFNDMQTAIHAAEANPCYLQVTTPDGRSLCLDLREKPALLFAAWCIHCDEALKDAAKLSPEERPYLVMTYLRDGDAKKAADKLAASGLAGEMYYLIKKPPSRVQGVPALVWWDEDLKYVEGVESVAEQLNILK